MDIEEFHQKFIKLDIVKKGLRIDRIIYGELTPFEIYKRLKRIENDMKPLLTEQNDLLKIAKEYFDSLPKPKIDYRE